MTLLPLIRVGSRCRVEENIEDHVTGDKRSVVSRDPKDVLQVSLDTNFMWVKSGFNEWEPLTSRLETPPPSPTNQDNPNTDHQSIA